MKQDITTFMHDPRTEDEKDELIRRLTKQYSDYMLDYESRYAYSINNFERIESELHEASYAYRQLSEKYDRLLLKLREVYDKIPIPIDHQDKDNEEDKEDKNKLLLTPSAIPLTSVRMLFENLLKDTPALSSYRKNFLMKFKKEDGSLNDSVKEFLNLIDKENYYNKDKIIELFLQYMQDKGPTEIATYFLVGCQENIFTKIPKWICVQKCFSLKKDWRSTFMGTYKKADATQTSDIGKVNLKHLNKEYVENAKKLYAEIKNHCKTVKVNLNYDGNLPF